jgi:hypothetical protein
VAHGAADGSADADAGAEAPLAGEGRQPFGGGLVQGGQGVDADGGDVGDAAGFDVGDPQRGAVRGGEDVDALAPAARFVLTPPLYSASRRSFR